MFAACAERFQAETGGCRASAKLREEDRAWRETVPAAEISKRYLPCVLSMQSCSEKVSRDAGVVVEILFYQGLIFITLVIVRFFAPKYIEVACFVWTALTLLNLFWPPLIALQLLVVWGTYAAIRPKDSAGPTGKIDPSPNPTREQKTESTPTRKNERREVSRSLSGKSITGASAGKTSIQNSNKGPAKRIPDLLRDGEPSTELSNLNSVDEQCQPKTASAPDHHKDLGTQRFVVETKRKRVLVPKPGTGRPAAPSVETANKSDKAKRTIGISDAEMERRLKALRAAKTREAENAANRAAEEMKREDERTTVRRQARKDVTPLLDALKAKRRALAEAARVPAYVIFPDRTLNAMAEKRPVTMDQLAKVDGVGAKKLERYGAAFLEVLTSDAEAMTTVPCEANGVWRQDLQDIRAEVERRGIPHLVHFTRCENLRSIFRHGLLSVSDCRAQGIHAVRNDMMRLDGKPEGISLSVTFPNYRMFYKYRQVEPTADWAVLLLSVSILWEKECAFFKYNAADARMRGLSREHSATALALREMFENSSAPRPPWLRPYDPVDPQAEVMAYEAIEPDLIETVAFETKDAAEKWKSVLGGVDTIYAGRGKGLFGSRAQIRGN